MQRLQKTGGVWDAIFLPGRTSIPVRCPDLSPLFAALTKTAGCVPRVPILEGGVLPTFKCAFCIPNGVAGRSTFKPSNDPPVPLQRKALGATIGKGARNSSRSGETTPLPPVSKDSERTSGTARSWSPSQVVPGSSVLTLDRSAGWLAFQQRVGKAGSVRLG